MTPVRSLLVSLVYYPPGRGGIATLMGQVVSALKAEETACLTGVRSPSRQDGRHPAMYRLGWLPQSRDRLLHAALSLVVGWIILTRRFGVVQFAVVNEAVIGPLLHRRLGARYIVWAHGNEVLQLIKSQEPRLLRAIREADAVVTISGYTRGLVRQAGVSADRIATIYPSVDSDRFRPRPPDAAMLSRLIPGPPRRLLLTIGGLVLRKGQDMVIRALPLIAREVPDVAYLVVGAGPMRSSLEALAGSLGAAERVIFAGAIPPDELPAVYNLADLFVMPSREQGEIDVEGFGLVFLEASASGLPIVAGRSGGIAEAVIDNVTGLLVDPNDPAAIGQAIVRVLTDRKLASRLGAAGRSHAVTRASPARFAEALSRLLEDVLAGRPLGA